MNQNFNYLNSGTLALENNYYKKYFKFYELSFMVLIAYLSLSFEKHGLLSLTLYYIVMAPSLILATLVLGKFDNNITANINIKELDNELSKYNIFPHFLKIWGVDYYLINNFPNNVIRNHIYQKLYMISVAPLIIYIAVGIR